MAERETIAKISAMQAIIVAMITMAGTLGAAYLSGFRTTTEGEETPNHKEHSINFACYQAILDNGNIETICTSQERVSRTVIFPNQLAAAAKPTRCISSGVADLKATNSIIFYLESGPCDNGRNVASAKYECLRSPLEKSFQCGKATYNSIYLPPYTH